MKSLSKVFVTMVVVGFLTPLLFAASWIVYPGGDSLQQVINNAAEGDSITILDGNYMGDISINKGLDIRADGSNANIHGMMSLSGVSNAVYMEGLQMGISQDGSISISDCVDVRLRDIHCDDDLVVNECDHLMVEDVIFTGHISVRDCADVVIRTSTFTVNSGFRNSTLYVVESVFPSFFLTNCIFTLQGVSSPDLTSTATLQATILDCSISSCDVSGVGEGCTIFQSNVSGMLSVSSVPFLIGYNELAVVSLSGGGAESMFVGNTIRGRSYQSYDAFFTLNSSGSKILNNYFLIISTNSHSHENYTYDHENNGVLIEGGSPLIQNNTISLNLHEKATVRDIGFHDSGNGIYVSSGTPMILANDINVTRSGAGYLPGVNSGYSILADSTTTVNYNYLPDGVSGGCSSWNPASGVTNQGPPEAFYNDLDGSRNDVGCLGGHSYDPDGSTTTNPVVMGASATPMYLKRGDVVTLEACGVVNAE